MSTGAIGPLLKGTYCKWSSHHAPRLGASVAFYALLSFAPLLMLTIAIVSLIFGQQQAQNYLVDQARQMIGNHGGDMVKLLLQNGQKPSSGIIAGVIALLILLFGASGVFAELREALNIIWDAQPKSQSGLLGMLKERLFSFGMVLSVGFLLLVSLVMTSGLAFIGKFLSHMMPVPGFIMEILNFVISFAVISFLFAMMFKFVPARDISWKSVRVGAIGTALLFTVGKLLLGLYLGKASVGSGYGAAGSLVAVIVWIYYSAQIFFFGAEFTRIYADAHPGVAGAHQLEPEASRPRIGKQPRNLNSDRDVIAPLRAKSRTSLLITAGIGFLVGRKSTKSNRAQ
ncbi:MAG TPA: YihY/virulence factor BrkB family protein [Bryobacteraceae bacterium]|nr:YihY/virulence factor BrkB family protein [Bryobacteraceae bacterium]